jgi:WD40 repeat protein
VAIGGYGGVQLLSTTSVQTLSLRTLAQSVYAVAFSPDGKTLAVGGALLDSNGYPDGGILELWSVSTGTLNYTLKTSATAAIEALAFTPDGRTLAAGGIDVTDGNSGGVLELWNVKTGILTCEVGTHAVYGVYAVAFSPDGKILASGGSGAKTGIVELWNATGHPIRSMPSATLDVYSIAWSPKTHLLVDGGSGGILEIWNASNGDLISLLPTSNGEVVSTVTFTPDGTTIIDSGSWVVYDQDYYGSVDYYAAIEGWNVSTLQQTTSKGWSGNISGLQYSPDGSLLSGVWFSYDPYYGWYGVPIAFDSHSLAQVSVPVSDNAVTSTVFSPDGSTLISGGSQVTLWNAATGAEIATLPFQGLSFLYSVALSPDGKTLAGGSSSGTLTTWSLATGTQSTNYATSAGMITSVAFTSDGAGIAIAGEPLDASGHLSSGVLELRDSANGKLKYRFKTHADMWVSAVTLSGRQSSGGRRHQQ